MCNSNAVNLASHFQHVHMYANVGITILELCTVVDREKGHTGQLYSVTWQYWKTVGRLPYMVSPKNVECGLKKISFISLRNKCQVYEMIASAHCQVRLQFTCAFT